MRNGIILTFIAALFFIASCSDNRISPRVEPVDKMLRGFVADESGNPLPNVTVSVYQSNKNFGLDPSDAELTTDENGYWEKSFTIYSNMSMNLFFTRTGYIDVVTSAHLFYAGEDTVDTGVIRLPNMEFPDVYRIVLTWGGSPADLDAHLTGPKGDGSRFHVYWDDRRAVTPEGEHLARLIMDRRNGYGPEVVAIEKLLPGKYRFSVHNYSANQAPGDTLLASVSNATVKVYDGNGLIREFSISGDNAPEDKRGNLWRVLEIDGETGNIEFINELYDGTSFDDEGLFRRAGGSGVKVPY